jgi:hypothetical protein
MLVRIEHALPHRFKKIREARIGGPARANREKVDTVSDQNLVVEQGLSGCRDPDHDVIALSKSSDQCGQSGKQRYEERATVSRAGPLERDVLVTFDPSGLRSAVKRFHGRPRTVGRQVECANWIHELTVPVPFDPSNTRWISVPALLRIRTE